MAKSARPLLQLNSAGCFLCAGDKSTIPGVLLGLGRLIQSEPLRYRDLVMNINRLGVPYIPGSN